MIFSEAGFRRFRLGVTLALIVVCNLALWGALRVIGPDLDFVLTHDALLYDPQAGHCLRTARMEVSGVEGRIPVCSEWLDVTDPTGRVHALQEGEPLAMSVDGNLYYENADQADRRLLGLLIFAGVVIYLGMRAKRHLLTWYETRLRKNQPSPDA